jgi:polysaccharide biosynthesis/export protein
MKRTKSFFKSIYFIILMTIFGLSSCSINKDFIFRTDEDMVFDPLPKDTTSGDFKIAASNMLEFDLYTNEGALVLEFTTSDVQRTTINSVQGNLYQVHSDGYCEFPVIGRVYVAGLSIPECQQLLEEKYSGQFIKPYALVKVVNRRVLVYTGERAAGMVVPLSNSNVSLLEAISLAGGLGENANAKKVRIYRMVNGQQMKYSFDFSKIEGLNNAYFLVQNGDIIHVEPVPRLARELQKDILPVVQIFSGLAIVYGVFTRIL